MAGDAKLYIRRGLSSPDLNGNEVAGAGNSLPVRAYPNGVPPKGQYFIVKVPGAGADAGASLVCALKDAADNGSGSPGAFAAVAEGTTITFPAITAAAQVKAAIFTQSREWLGADFTPTAGKNFGKVAAYIGNEVPRYQ